ncbi:MULTISPECIES: hypothetical protein [Bacillus]|nr:MULTISPECIES: hypothetical protein [Bacillus]MCY7499158.1 hypothetical protein [Bacillus altitudinis]MCY7537178.1 hypothetical protein [Bacillus altitudinis]MCY7548650.1 hypothetical protein [Bacillus altitudinis]MCY7555590.1 hypothetical protein [Bacillus altitudinis]MCY7591698.1 hypothetical protein [Bacillus altitudinis]
MSKTQKVQTELVLKQIKRIFIRTREPFIEQYNHKKFGVGWVQRKYMLTDNVIRSNIKGERTIGTFYFGNATIFLIFDIDVEGDIWPVFSCKGNYFSIRRLRCKDRRYTRHV